MKVVKYFLSLCLSAALLLSAGGVAAASHAADEITSADNAASLKNEMSPATALSRYSDVPADAWYASAVQFVSEHGLMIGTAENTFSPDGIFSRAQLAIVLYRLAGEPEVSGEDPFTDTAAGTQYADAVLWASQQKIVSGYGGGLFGPHDPVTQQQLITMIWRSENSPSSGSVSIPDDVSPYAEDAVRWAYDRGIISESDGYTFSARESATRAQVAVLLQSVLTKDSGGIGEIGGDAAKPAYPSNISAQSSSLKAVSISFDFHRMSTHASNQAAVWVENENGNLVKTLYVSNFTAARKGYAVRPDALSAWVSAANPSEMSDPELDAVSGATPSTGKHTFTWDLTDSTGNRVPDGVYSIMLEGTLYWSSNVLYTAQIDTSKAVSENIPVQETRSEPSNTENETMIGNVNVIAIIENANTERT